MKRILQFIFEVGKVVVIALVIVVPLRVFVFQPFLVRGDSMEPNYHTGDYLIIDQLSYRFRAPLRGEVIVLKFPLDTSQRFIKRIVGLPGETIEVKDGKVVVYGEEGSERAAIVLDESTYLSFNLQTPGSARIDLQEEEYFVLGDNRPFSSDSRKWGILEKDLIVGRVFFSVFSLERFVSLREILQSKTREIISAQ
ncbi:signal peptidase I [Patescibacteria group bacterium]|nr:signal peptidase I [Patescibacteria group bacterium]